MSNEKEVFSPSKEVWRTHMEKGVYPPHRVSRITCVVNQLLSDKVVDLLNKLNVKIAYIEGGRNIRDLVKPRLFGLPGEISKLESSPVNIFRFTIPRKFTQGVVDAIITEADLHIPGRGSVFAQDLMEFSFEEPPVINNSILQQYKENASKMDYATLKNLSYVICVLSEPGSGEAMAKIALDLGICVPLLTIGTGNDIRDQLGLIRITISPEKEVIHLITPAQDSESVVRLLVEQGRLDRPGRGFIYQTPIGTGLIDTRLKIGTQKAAASVEQIIAAIDQLKAGTSWRKRLDTENEEKNSIKSFIPQDNCEISIITEEDRIDKLREVCLSVGATGAVTTRIKPVATAGQSEVTSTMVRSAISVPADITVKVVDLLLESSTIDKENIEKIHILDSPAAYVHSL